MWSKVDLTPQPEAIDAAKKADVVIAVVGITSELEGEEMQVSEPGFMGGDRTSHRFAEARGGPAASAGRHRTSRWWWC